MTTQDADQLDSLTGKNPKGDEGNTPLNVSMLKSVAQQGLINVLNSVNGAKTLVLDPSLAGPLSLVTDVSLLKHHGVDKLFWLENGPLNASTTNVVYLCRPQIKWMKIVANQIKSANATTSHTYTLILVPRRTTLCDRILEEEGVLGDLTITSYRLEFIPIDDDVLSLEMENVWREIYLDGDETSIFYSAQALLTIQQAFGLFPRILGKGDAAKKLANLLLKSRPPPSSRSPSLSLASTAIDSLIIIDRNVDLITPLLTQLTYEGLLDELFGIQNSHIKVDPALLSATTTQTPGASTSGGAGASSASKRKYHLHSSDHTFGMIRDENFVAVGPKLGREVRRLEAEIKARHQAQTINQLRDFVGRLGGIQNDRQAAGLHISLSEEISAYTHTDNFQKGVDIEHNLLQSYETSAQLTAIEDLVAQGAPIQLVLRLLCLTNLTTGGIKVKTLENLKREILQTYGYAYVPYLLSLSNTYLLTPLPIPKPRTDREKVPVPPPPFAPIRKAFRLLSDTDETAPTDVSYVYSAYAPLSVRLVQCVAQKGGVLASASGTGTRESDPNLTAHGHSKTASEVPETSHQGDEDEDKRPFAAPISGWKGFEDALKLIPGATVDVTQQPDARPGAGAGGIEQNPLTHQDAIPRDRPTTTMVFFLGGCTFTEISALRWMSSQMRGRRFLIGTTGMINGSTLLESIGDGPAVKFMSGSN